VISSRTPEGPLNFCPICGTHCRIEPSLLTKDAVCPRCGSLLWFPHRAEATSSADPAVVMRAGPQSAQAARYWEPSWVPSLYFGTPAVATAAEVRAWEAGSGVRLPATLAQALVAQNGGRWLGTEVDIEPLSQFAPLGGQRWDHLFVSEPLDPESRGRLIRIGVGLQGSVVLDYRRGKRPRVRIMDHIEAGELRAEFGSFDRMVRAARAACAKARQEFEAARAGRT
jgi:hypothetical protein